MNIAQAQCSIAGMANEVDVFDAWKGGGGVPNGRGLYVT